MKNRSVCLAVRELRSALGLNQTDFGTLIGKSLPTIQRYESDSAPKGDVLTFLLDLAHSKGLTDIAGVFQDARSRELFSAALENADPFWEEHRALDYILKSSDQDLKRKWDKMIRETKLLLSNAEKRVAALYGNSETRSEIASILKLPEEQVEILISRISDRVATSLAKATPDETVKK